MSIEIIPLGAGREVGRSCVIVRMAGRTLMFDCGIHMGYEDQRRFPDFSHIAQTDDFTPYFDCVLITHFHLDHCGALPYFTEMKGYNGPVFMSGPTRAIAPLMLEDFRKVCVEYKGESNFFTSEMIKGCMAKVTTIELHQTITVCGDINITAYYAGHVLGAIMYHIECRGYSLVYTGDYNMAGDRHLRGAWIERLDPHVVISESTYATKYKELKMRREKMFLKKVVQTIERGGKVLIPVFALGRAQELCILLDTYWHRTHIEVPIHFAGALSEKANLFYKTYINWCNENVQRTFLMRNMFDFQHITPFDRGNVKAKEPMVLLATPGMLHGGLSLSVFKEWCEDSKNTLILPGYCVPGTVGHTLLKSKPDVVMIEGKEYEIRCEVQAMSFSAHTDHRGIMQVLKWINPKNVVLVHGEEERMRGLLQDVQQTMNVPCFMPGNLEHLMIQVNVSIPMKIEYPLICDYRTNHHINFVENIFNNNPRPLELECNITDDWILEDSRNISFSCELLCSLNQLKSTLEDSILQLLSIEEIAESRLQLTWDVKDDALVSPLLSSLQQPA